MAATSKSRHAYFQKQKITAFVLIPRSALVVVVKVFGQLLPQHFISLALMTECYSAFKQPLLDVLGKIAPKIDDRRTHDAGKPIIPLVQHDGLRRFHLGDKIYCSVPSRRIRSPIQRCFRRVFRLLHYWGLLALRRLTLTLILHDRNGWPQRFVGQFETDIDSSRNAGEDGEGTWFSTSEGARSHKANGPSL